MLGRLGGGSMVREPPYASYERRAVRTTLAW